MELHVLGSSSLGNNYLLKGESESLVIECGLPLRGVRRENGGSLVGIIGAVVSHRHGDHAKFLTEYLDANINVLAPYDAFESKHRLSDPCAHPIRRRSDGQPKGYRMGGFKIQPFDVEHDVPCMGYIIEHEEMGRLFFATDTMDIKQRMPDNVRIVMIEANYADDILEYNIEHDTKGRFPASLRPRLLRSHMEIGTTEKVLNSCFDLAMVDEIILIHLSDANSNERRFIRDIELATGKHTVVADTGRVFDISIEPY